MLAIVDVQADKDWKFIKWKLNNEDYSTEKEITITVNNNLNLIAVFEPTADNNLLISNNESAPKKSDDKTIIYVGIGCGTVALIIIGAIGFKTINKKKSKKNRRKK